MGLTSEMIHHLFLLFILFSGSQALYCNELFSSSVKACKEEVHDLHVTCILETHDAKKCNNEQTENLQKCPCYEECPSGCFAENCEKQSWCEKWFEENQGPYPDVKPTTSSSSTTTLLTTTKLDDLGSCETNFTEAVFQCHEAVLKLEEDCLHDTNDADLCSEKYNENLKDCPCHENCPHGCLDDFCKSTDWCVLNLSDSADIVLAS